jgi:hypothetical protein
MSSASLKNLSVHDKSSNQIMLQPKLQFRWRVTFDKFGQGGALGSVALTRQVSEMTRPQVKFAEITLPVYNSTVYLAGKYNWEPITMKVRDDLNGNVSTAVAEQISKQVDFQQMASAATGTDYKFSTHIDVLDGNNGSTAPEVLETWDLFGCYLQMANYDSINYATNEPMTISLTIRFDNAAQSSRNHIKILGGGAGLVKSGDDVNAMFTDTI